MDIDGTAVNQPSIVVMITVAMLVRFVAVMLMVGWRVEVVDGNVLPMDEEGTTKKREKIPFEMAL